MVVMVYVNADVQKMKWNACTIICTCISGKKRWKRACTNNRTCVSSKNKWKNACTNIVHAFREIGSEKRHVRIIVHAFRAKKWKNAGTNNRTCISGKKNKKNSMHEWLYMRLGESEVEKCMYDYLYMHFRAEKCRDVAPGGIGGLGCGVRRCDVASKGVMEVAMQEVVYAGWGGWGGVRWGGVRVSVVCAQLWRCSSDATSRGGFPVVV